MTPGDLLRITGLTGQFRYHYTFEGDGSLTCWGPVDSQHAQWRSFAPNRVRKVTTPKEVRSGRAK